MRTLEINAKCSDMCHVAFDNEEGNDAEGDGGVPRHLGIGGGDYIRLTIDCDSGQILDWNYPEDDEIIDEIKKM